MAEASRHADPDLVLAIAVSSFGLLVLLVLCVSLSLRRRGFFDVGSYRYPRSLVLQNVVIGALTVAVPFALILNANLQNIKNDRASELVERRAERDNEVRALVAPVVASKLQECIAYNSPLAEGSPRDAGYWCRYQLENGAFGDYERYLETCVSTLLDGPQWQGISSIEQCEESSDQRTWRGAGTYSAFLNGSACDTIAASNSNFSFLREFCPAGSWESTLDSTSSVPCDGTDSCYPEYDQNAGGGGSEEYDPYWDDWGCVGDCMDMDNDGLRENDIDADGDGLYESRP